MKLLINPHVRIIILLLLISPKAPIAQTLLLSELINFEKPCSLAECHQEGNEKAQLKTVENGKECELSKAKRLKREADFNSRVDSFNKIVDSINVNEYQLLFHKEFEYEKMLERAESLSFEERRIQDSIEMANRMEDSLAALEFLMEEEVPKVELQKKYGVSMYSAFILEYPVQNSKAKSCLYQNESITIVGAVGDYYEILFDVCDENGWDDIGYVLKSAIKLEEPKNAGKLKKR
jgi:hypothetical protein